MQVIKANGRKEEFNPEMIRSSLMRAGVDRTVPHIKKKHITYVARHARMLLKHGGVRMCNHGILDNKLFERMNNKKITGILLLLFMITLSPSALGANSNNSAIPPDDSAYFSKIYVDGFSVNSNGFELILRTYERHQEIHFKPFLADIEYVLMTQGRVIYSKRVEQIPLSAGSEGEIVLNHHGHIALEAGKNYTGMAKVYLYSQGIPEYYLTASSNFTARNDADITEVYGDSIGASATIKSMSMVPLNAKIIFNLKQDARIIETKEIAAPSIMSNDKEKTVNVLWNDNLNEGIYMVSVLLEGNDITVNHDKVFTVEKRVAVTPQSAAQPGNSGHSIPGFTLVLAILAMVAVVLIFRRGR